MYGDREVCQVGPSTFLIRKKNASSPRTAPLQTHTLETENPFQSPEEQVLAISYVYLPEGGVSATIANIPGKMWAPNEEVLADTLGWILQQIEQNELNARKYQAMHTIRRFDLGMLAGRIHNQYCVRFASHTNFAAFFVDQQEFQSWLASLVSYVLSQLPKPQRVND